MLCIVYVSSAVRELADAELTALLEQCQGKNARLEITGILLYKDGDIMQLIEGPTEAIRRLARTIYADPRHHQIIQLLEREISTREFAGWSMDFQNLSASKVDKLAEFMADEPIESPSGADHRSTMIHLLRSFGFRS